MFKPTSKGTSAAASNHLSVTNQSTAADLCVLLQHEKLKKRTTNSCFSSALSLIVFAIRGSRNVCVLLAGLCQ